MASVARRNGAPSMAPTPMSPAVLLPVKSDAIMATTGMEVSGRAVPTAASTLPTAPSPRFSRSPRISTVLTNKAAATTTATSDSTSSMAGIIECLSRGDCGSARPKQCSGFYPLAGPVTLKLFLGVPLQAPGPLWESSFTQQRGSDIHLTEQERHSPKFATIIDRFCIFENSCVPYEPATYEWTNLDHIAP